MSFFLEGNPHLKYTLVYKLRLAVFLLWWRVHPSLKRTYQTWDHWFWASVASKPVSQCFTSSLLSYCILYDRATPFLPLLQLKREALLHPAALTPLFVLHIPIELVGVALLFWLKALLIQQVKVLHGPMVGHKAFFLSCFWKFFDVPIA